MAKLVAQSEEDGTTALLACAALPDAKSGEFWGPGMGVMSSKGEAKPYPFEDEYNSEEARELIWQKSCEAIGKDFDL